MYYLVLFVLLMYRAKRFLREVRKIFRYGRQAETRKFWQTKIILPVIMKKFSRYLRLEMNMNHRRSLFPPRRTQITRLKFRI